MTELLRAAQAIAIAVVAIFPALAHGQMPRADSEEASQPISYGDQEVEAKGVGISGGAIAGAELVVAVEALFKVKQLWPYLTLPLVGAAGGGVGGYYLEKESPKGAVGLLVGSMVLLIPTAILASSARAYNPEEEGALEGDADGRFGFEIGPGEESQEDASTEMESRPEGAPTDIVLPQGSEKPPETGDEAEPEDEDQPEDEAAPEDDGDSGGGASARRDSLEESKRVARIRRATAGSLFYVDNDGTAAISMPAVAVRPVGFSPEDVSFKNKQAVEIFIPLLRMDLP